MVRKNLHNPGEEQDPGPRREEPVFTISIAARLTRLPIHTIRWLEANELCRPARTPGGQRLFSERDIDFLLELAKLLERKVNLAGIRTILQIKTTYRIERIELEIEEE